MPRPDVEGAMSYAMSRLAQELDPGLVYHSIVHTRDDVVPAVERLAALAGVGEPDLLLLRTAAAFHDLGFVVQSHGHELVSLQIAAATLPQFGYDPGQIRRIGELILATRLPQCPRTPLEQLLADADLDLLGREDFLARNQDLRSELARTGAPTSDAAWYEEQLHFISGHRYWSAAARGLRDAGKARNCAALAELLRGARAA